jgi:small subunit ribosomal protein S21
MTLTPALKAYYRLRRVRPNSGLKPKVDMSEVHLKKGEPVDKALRRLKKKLDREQTLIQVRLHRRFEKPSAKRRRKEKAARFSAMLKARYADV